MVLKKTLIDNSTDELKMSNILNQCIQTEGCNEIMIATGFWDLPGTSLLQEQLTAFLQRGGKLKLLIGKEPSVKGAQYQDPAEELLEKKTDILGKLIEHGIKEYYHATVKMLMNYTQSDFENSPIQIKIYKADQDGDGNNDFMHAKCYIFRNAENPNNYQPYGIIGSSNFTNMGLEGNAELNYLENDAYIINWEGSGLKGHVRWFTRLWEQANPWNEEFVLEGLEKVREKLPKEEPSDDDANTAASLTPYETYIRVLQHYYGDREDERIEGQIRSYLSTTEDIKPLDFQLKAVAQCYSIMKQYNGFMLSDVVGLGKTIIGLLVAKKFIEEANSLHRIPRVLIVTPPAVLKSWKETIEQLDKNAVSPIGGCVEFITTGSIGQLSDDEQDDVEDDDESEMEDFKSDDYGLILIDESHGFRNSETTKYDKLKKLIEKIGENNYDENEVYFPFVGLMSATPQNNSPRDLKNQLYLFVHSPNNSPFVLKDEDTEYGCKLDSFFVDMQTRFELYRNSNTPEAKEALKKIAHSIRQNVLDHIVVRRTRKDIEHNYPEEFKQLHFSEVQTPIAVPYQLKGKVNTLFNETLATILQATEETALLPHLSYCRYAAITYFKDPKNTRLYEKKNLTVDKITARLSKINRILLLKRMDSSIAAFIASLVNLRQYTQNMVDMLDHHRVYICPDIKVNDIFAKFDSYDAAAADIERRIKEKGGNNRIFSDKDFNHVQYRKDLMQDIAILSKLIDDWKNIKLICDPKLDAFKDAILNQFFDPQKNEGKKLVIFTEAKATQEELCNCLESMDDRYKVLTISAENRAPKGEVIKANFDANLAAELQKDDYNIIITTEVLAEGVNLHRSNIIVNYDTPWNATRLMQRIGRVNRIVRTGKAADKVWIFNFHPADDTNRQIRLIEKAYAKLQTFHTMFGEDGKVYSEEEELYEANFSHLMNNELSPDAPHFLALKQYKENHTQEEYDQLRQLPLHELGGSRSNAADPVFLVGVAGKQMLPFSIDLSGNVHNIDRFALLNTLCADPAEKYETTDDTILKTFSSRVIDSYQRAVNRSIKPKDVNKRQKDALQVISLLRNELDTDEAFEAINRVTEAVQAKNASAIHNVEKFKDSLFTPDEKAIQMAQNIRIYNKQQAEKNFGESFVAVYNL